MIKKVFITLGISVALLIVGIVVLLVLAGSFNPSKYEGNVDEKLSQYLEDKGEDFQGTVLVAKGNDIVFEKSFGWADKKRKVKNENSTQYQIGSITKSITATAILLLEEKGKLKTSDPLAKYLPDFPNGKEITLHHLLTHTSGIYNYTSGEFVQKKKVTPEKIVSWFAEKKPEFSPGEDFSYSNSNYILLGMVIEKVSGMKYEKFIEENITKPIELEHTTAVREEATKLAIGYKGDTKDTFIDNSVPYAAGMVISTANDLFKYSRTIHQGEILSDQSRTKLFKPERSDYAYGWVTSEVLGEDMHMHNGGINGFRSIMTYYPESEYTIIILSNNVYYNVDSMSLDLSAILFNEKVNIFDRF
jgi:CubicO group peptidase (beta-lactamase class C family)